MARSTVAASSARRFALLNLLSLAAARRFETVNLGACSDPSGIAQVSAAGDSRSQWLLVCSGRGENGGLRLHTSEYAGLHNSVWSHAGVVFGAESSQGAPSWLATEIPDWSSSGGYYQAPDLLLLQNGTTLLYYAVHGATASCIGVATTFGSSPVQATAWTDIGQPVTCSTSDTFVPADPHVIVTGAGEWWLVGGEGTGGIWRLQLDARTGLAMEGAGKTHVAQPDAAQSPGNAAAWLLEHNSSYYLLLNRALDIVVGRGASVGGPFVDRDGRALLEGGGTVLVDHAHAPFHSPAHVGLCEACGDTRVLEPQLEPHLRSQTRGDDVLSFHFDSFSLGAFTVAHFALGWRSIDGVDWPEVKWGAWAPCTFTNANHCEPGYSSAACPHRGATHLEAADVRTNSGAQGRLGQ